jgi:hypothetical protein
MDLVVIVAVIQIACADGGLVRGSRFGSKVFRMLLKHQVQRIVNGRPNEQGETQHPSRQALHCELAKHSALKALRHSSSRLLKRARRSRKVT